MLKAQVEKVDSMYQQMGNINMEREWNRNASN